jgi:predicted AlkP superfamily phosphohydrolase/phosphomutase
VHHRVLVIGLDGATWDLIDPWIREGRLPCLARLRSSGLAGPLASTVPPATLPSWSTFMTGVNPGKHGIFDFTRRAFGTYEVRFVNATFRKAPTVWQLLSAAGRRVCVLGLPGTYPPETVNGYMISGFDTPVTTRADASFISPRTLAPLVQQLGGFPFADFQEFRINRSWYRVALDRLLHGIEIKTRLARVLLRQEPWDCFLLVFGESDTVAHHFWKFCDPRSPRFDAGGASEFGTAIRQVYEALDHAIGRLCEVAPEAAVLVASDHGFGGSSNKVVYLNQWLAHRGLQRARQQQPRSRMAAAAKRLALQAMPAGLQAWAFRLNGGRWASRLESHARFAGIDWATTRAFSEELNYFPSVWLNLKGREPQGIVDPADYERVRDEVCAGAAALRDPEHGAPVIRRAWRREELYRGPWVHYAPDIILEFALDRQYTYTCLPSAAAASPSAVGIHEAGECGEGKLAGLSGSHRPDGVFLLAQPEQTARYVQGIDIADMAPTILELCGVQPPAEFDGKTVCGVAQMSQGPSPAVAGRPPGERVYTAAEEHEIAERLTHLGYLS